MTYDPYSAPCANNCGQQVDIRRAYYRLEGWTKPRQDGGTNHVVNRQPFDEFMCDNCMDKLLDGVSLQQLRLGA